MTYLQAIKEELQPFPIRNSLIEWKCQKHAVKATDEASENVVIATICVEIISQMVTLNNVSEGGVSITFYTKQVNAMIKRLCDEANLDSTMYANSPKVKYLGDF